MQAKTSLVNLVMAPVRLFALCNDSDETRVATEEILDGKASMIWIDRGNVKARPDLELFVSQSRQSCTRRFDENADTYHKRLVVEKIKILLQETTTER